MRATTIMGGMVKVNSSRKDRPGQPRLLRSEEYQRDDGPGQSRWEWRLTGGTATWGPGIGHGRGRHCYVGLSKTTDVLDTRPRTWAARGAG